MGNIERPSVDERDIRGLDGQLLSDLWVFLAAARVSSIGAAAAQLNVTAGAVSQRVLRLEARLKVELFRRSGGKVALTDAGGVMLEAMNRASLVLNNAIASIDTSKRTSIVVSCGTSLAVEWLVPRLQDFYRECPDIELLVRAQSIIPSASFMTADAVDVLIHCSHRRCDDLVEIACVRELIFPVCSPEYRARLHALPVAERTVVAMHDVEPWLEGESPRAQWQEWLEWAGARRGFEIGAERLFNQASLAYQAAMYGQGVAIGHAVGVNGLLMTNKLVPLFDGPAMPSACYRILARTDEATDSPIRRFAAWVARNMARTQQETIALTEIRT